MNRRDLLVGGAVAGAALGLPRRATAESAFAPRPGAWRTFEVRTRLDLAPGAAQAWVPLPSVNEAGWSRALGSTWTTDAARAEIVSDPRYGATMLHAAWPEGSAPSKLEVVSRVQVRDRSAAPDGTASPAILTEAERRLYLSPTALIPTDGIVKETAERITRGRGTDEERARALYEWVVENTVRDAATRGCGMGDVGSMLRSGFLGGKCADLNALFVGLARASGLPARDVYGLRVAPSRFGYRSLGANQEVVTRAQHCRAEVFIAGTGWVAVDPADVRKVALEEVPGGLPLSDPRVQAARRTLFGAWEGNWIAYNVAHDVALPGSAGEPVGFLMYPEAEIRGARLDCLDPDRFRYTVRAAEIAA